MPPPKICNKTCFNCIPPNSNRKPSLLSTISNLPLFIIIQKHLRLSENIWDFQPLHFYWWFRSLCTCFYHGIFMTFNPWPYYNTNDLLHFTHNPIIKCTHDLPPDLTVSPGSGTRLPLSAALRYSSSSRSSSVSWSSAASTSNEIHISSAFPEAVLSSASAVVIVLTAWFMFMLAAWSPTVGAAAFAADTSWLAGCHRRDMVVYYNILCTTYADKITFDNKKGEKYHRRLSLKTFSLPCSKISCTLYFFLYF